MGDGAKPEMGFVPGETLNIWGFVPGIFASHGTNV
jgi:hypothetical protein